VNEREERCYLDGQRSAWVHLLGECLRQLGYDSPEAGAARWVKEREEAVAALRGLCGEFGDNDWDESLYLPDVLDKHLGDHLRAGD
jgi:hypothetical protein